MTYVHHYARIILRDRYGVPETPASLIEVMAEKEWSGAVARGTTGGLRRYSLGEFDADQLDRGKRQRRAIGPDFTPRFKDEKIQDWTEKTSAEMRAQRELVRGDLAARRDELEQTITEAGDDASEDDLQALSDLNAQLAEFGKSAFKEIVPDAFGDNSQAMYHSLGAPDVPSRYIATRYIDEDACHSLRLFAWQPPGNAKWEFSYTWSWWRLVISNQQVKLLRFNPELSQHQRDNLEAQIQALEDRGRLTAVDQKYINEQRAGISQIEQSARDDGRELNDDDKVNIQQYQKRIDDRQESKRGLTPQQSDQLETLKKKLYSDSATSNLYSAGKDFFNKALTLTFIPDTRGYLIICLGDQTWCYTDKTIRKTGYRGTMWKASLPEVACSGGAYVWQVGDPEFTRKNIFELEPRRIPSSEGAFTWSITGDWDAASDKASIHFHDPAQITGTGNADIPALAAFKIEFKSDGRVPAMLHQCAYYCPPGSPHDTSQKYFDSDDHLIDGDPPIEDLELSYSGDRDSVSYAVTILDTDGFLSARDAVGRRAEVWIDGERLEKYGIVKSVNPKFLAAPDGDEEEPIWRADSRLELVIGEQWDLLDADLIHDQVTADGLSQGKALRLALEGRGVEMDIDIPDTAGITLGRASRVLDGVAQVPLRDAPLWRPAANVRRGAWLRKISDVDDTHRLYIDRGTWKFDAWDETPVAEFFSDLDYDGRYQILDEVELPEDTSETFNVFTVTGGIDEKTGKRIERTRVIYESLNDPDDPRYLGYEKYFDVVADETLTTEEMVMDRLDALERQHCKPTKRVLIKTFFHTTLRPKRYIIIRGLKYQIASIASNALAHDDLAFIARRALE